ncbi:MAG: 4Fe-4S cluster-binding domain-containing protein [Fibromonadales bacterium]|nr:4Fe-4S cluster-binding domain-containing protein [Fibromonadales bacterium]
MTYYLISLTNRCNKSCDYCVVKRWRNNPDYPDRITAEDVIAFLGKELKENDIVELTGGEPTLFEGLTDVLDCIHGKNAKTILRTNGLRLGEWRKKYGSMIVILAKHDSGAEYMNERKKLLSSCDLVEDDPSKIISSDSAKPDFKVDEASPANWHKIDRTFFVTADGNLRFMPCSERSWGNIIGLRYEREQHLCFEMHKCPYMLGAWNLAARLSA